MNSNHKSLVFINSPINGVSDDIIGFSSYADKLQDALDSGAKMIAVTSPFGSGKSSLSKLLEENLQTDPKYKCVRISLWPQLLKRDTPDSPLEVTELHRYFLYQLISKINPRRATYIDKKLNGNYGLWKIYIDGIGGFALAMLSAALFILSLIIGKFAGDETEIFNLSAKVIGDFALVFSIISFGLALWKSEILFSSRRSEGQRTTTPSDLVEIFKKYVLKHNAADCYVIIIEDLDRTDSNNLVVTFLKELRKYYIEDENGKIAFIVNIKPESFIHNHPDENERHSRETLYSKLFDYILNLQSINISDYDAILNSLLQQKANLIKNLLRKDHISLESIPEMEWIIRGNELSIRVIKDRLNKAFSLYESLINKFSDSPVDFGKCTSATYLITAFEKDFYQTDHEAFGRLVEAYIQGNLTEKLDKELSNCNVDYRSAVAEMINAHLIDDEYHMYYYNYPQEGRIYYSDEIVVRSGILYGIDSGNLQQMAERSLVRKSSIFQESFEKIKRLKISIPDIVIETEPLYIEALHYHPDGVYEWIQKLDYNDESKNTTIEKIFKVLSFDSSRNVFNATHAKKYSEIWSKNFHEASLLSLRERLCKTFPQEIKWYTLLFEHPHNIISDTEIQYIDLLDAVSLVDTDCDTFNVSTIKSILKRLKFVWPNVGAKNAIENLIRLSYELGSSAATTDELLEFMDITACIPPDFENAVFLIAQDDSDVWARYRSIITKVEVSELSDQTLKNIYHMDRYDGFSEELSNRFYNDGYYYAAILLRGTENYPIDYTDQNIRGALAENNKDLVEHETIFSRIRESIIQGDPSLIEEYQFLFDANCPVICEKELHSLASKLTDPEILKLIPPELVTAAVVSYLIPFLNRKWHSNSEAYSILLEMATWENALCLDGFYKLDFVYRFQYDTFSRERRKNIRSLFTAILGLDSPKERIRFMIKTHWIDSTFDSTIIADINNNEDLWKQYFMAVNAANLASITKTTLANICKSPITHSLTKPICERLFQDGKYKRYITATTKRMGQFIMDRDDRLEKLWPVYVEIFISSGYENTRNHMCNNLDFLNELMQREAFISMPEQSRMALTKVNQSAQSIRDVLTYGETFAIKYFSSMEGFANKEAAIAFLDAIESSSVLLATDSIYDNTHDKLVDPRLKARYTTKRNKAVKE